MTELFHFGGKERPVAFGRGAYSDIEEITGVSLLNPRENDNYGTFKVMNAIVYAGLKWGLYKGNGIEPKPSFTMITVSEWVEGDDKTAANIILRFRESYLQTMKVKNAEAGGDPASPGTTSTESPLED